MKWKVEVITNESSNVLVETATNDTPDQEAVVGMGFPLKLANRIVDMHNTAIDEASKLGENVSPK